MDTRKEAKTTSIPVVEEKLRVDKEVRETGRVRVSKHVEEQVEDVDIPLNCEEVDIERVAVNHYVDTLPPHVRYEGDTMIVPVLREVIEKRVILVEELHIKKRQIQKQEQQSVKLRKEIVKVESEP